jgi:SAM-dependent methyltransferase
MLDGSVRRCQSCGFRWTAETGEGAGRTDLFDGRYYRNYFARAAHWRYEARRRLRWLLSAVRPASLVEAGPAGGFFLEAARQAGITVEGVEVSDACVRFARDQLQLPVVQGCFETAPITRPVQAVCAFHVLEHVDDPRQFLATARDALTPDGWLALEVPNIDSAAAHRQGPRWPHLQLECHRWHFSPESLTRLVRDHGFEVRRYDTVLCRYYMTPRQLLTPWGVSMAIKECATTGTVRTTHSRRGDLLRLLAQLPARSSVR